MRTESIYQRILIPRLVRHLALAVLAGGTLVISCAESTSVSTEGSPPALRLDTALITAKPVTKAVAKVKIETLQFPAEDGLLVTADLYQWHEVDAPFIILFHQAGWSRGEYKEIAPKLGELGFNCLAVDLRSGKAVNNVVNATAKAAAAKRLPTTFLDALPDMRAALRLVATRYPDAKRIAWGSSYSASLVLVLAGEEPQLVSAAIALSPGEYFSQLGATRAKRNRNQESSAAGTASRRTLLGKHYVRDAAKKISVPTFITSAKNEQKSWRAIYEAIPTESKQSFVPKTKGNHGARALWATHSDAPAYWAALTPFLEGLAPASSKAL